LFHAAIANGPLGGVHLRIEHDTLAVADLVLVVDDDALILQSLEEALEDGGYAVASAHGSEDAIDMLNRKAADYRAVVTDVNMGADKPTGWDVARHARQLSHDIPVVYITGDSAGDWTANGVPHSILISKPFAPAQVVTAVSQLINAALPPAP
jgi:CheY-like chemotaxis protein